MASAEHAAFLVRHLVEPFASTGDRPDRLPSFARSDSAPAQTASA
jgi:hypothetical protein